MSIRLSKKNTIILSSIFFVILAGAGGYLLWRVNNQETLAEVPGLAANCGAVCIRTESGGISSSNCVPGNSNEMCAGYTNSGGTTSYCDYQIVCDGEDGGASTTVVCGNGSCETGENVLSCPADCSTCGDGQCTGSETESTCPADCATCGDGICSSTESVASCPADCAVCGDGICSSTETSESCSEDCLCKDITWTNKPDGTYPTDNVFGDITVTNPNSTNTDGTGVAITLNSETVGACPSDTGTCYTLSNDTNGYEVITLSLFNGNTNIEEGTYLLSLTLPVDDGECASETVSTSASFVIKADAVAVVPSTGILDGVMGKIYLGTGFVFLGILTTQAPKFAYAFNTLGKRMSDSNRTMIEKRDIERTQKKRNKFEKKFR